MPLTLIRITLKEVKCQQYKAIVHPFVKSFFFFFKCKLRLLGNNISE